MPLAVLIIGPIAGSLSDKIHPNKITAVGAVVGIISLLLLSTLNVSTNIIVVCIILFIFGSSFAIFIPPNMKFIMGQSPKEMRGVTSGIINTARMTANAFGVAILQTVTVVGIYLFSGTFSKTTLTPDQIVVGFHDAYLVGAIIIVIALILILLVKNDK